MGEIGELFWQVFLAFAFLVAFLGVVYFFVRRRNPFASSKNIRVIERCYLDRNSSIVLVRLIDSYYVLLITPGGGTVLKELSESEAGHLEEAEKFSSIFFKKLGKNEKKDGS